MFFETFGPGSIYLSTQKYSKKEKPSDFNATIVEFPAYILQRSRAPGCTF